MKRHMLVPIILHFLLVAVRSSVAQDALIHVHADRLGPEVSRYMTGVCIEDVNHEIYGGIYSQMIFGESFQEPPLTTVDGFTAYGGSWVVKDGVLHASPGDGPKLVLERPPLAAGDVSVQIQFADTGSGLAGLIVQVNDPAVGADRFHGYEVSLDPSRQCLGFGRHRGNWEHIQDVSCAVPVGRWIDLSVSLTKTGLSIRVDGRRVFDYEDREHPLPSGKIGLLTWQREASFRAMSIRKDSQIETIPLRSADPYGLGGVSGMWRPVKRGSPVGRLSLDADRPFAGSQSQRITFESGDGAIGVENRGLNRWGMSFVAGKLYEGYLWMRAERPTEVIVAAENNDGSRIHAQVSLPVEGVEWRRYDFSLTPVEEVRAGRLAITLKTPGSVLLGHAFLQPGPWGRFKDLPVRKDVAEGLLSAGVTVMRLGGLMANGGRVPLEGNDRPARQAIALQRILVSALVEWMGNL